LSVVSTSDQPQLKQQALISSFDLNSQTTWLKVKLLLKLVNLSVDLWLNQPERGWDSALIQPAIQLQKMINSTAFQWPKHFQRKRAL